MALQDGKRRAEHPRSLMQRKNHRLQFRSRRGGHRSARVCLKVQRQLDEGHLPHSRLPLQLPQPAQQGLSERRLPPPLRVGHLADHELVLRPRPWFGSQQLRIGEGTRRPSWLVEQALEEPLPAHPHPQDPAKQGKQCAHKLAGRSHRGSLEQVHRGEAAQSQARRPFLWVHWHPGDLRPRHVHQLRCHGLPDDRPGRALPEQVVLVFDHSSLAVGAVGVLPQSAAERPVRRPRRPRQRPHQ
mmetsp:Transcript_95235/g.164337  ORF Transcript_95235/g.164337 Transcript_95235/m.164337 type:complete len:242 (-) Transcript_95235:593-1318(-)